MTQLTPLPLPTAEVVFDGAAVGMVVFDLDGRIVRVNPAFCQLVGRSEDDLLGLAGLDLIHPEDRDELRDRQRSLGPDLRHGPDEVRMVHASGQVVHVVSTGAALPDDNGRPAGLFCQFVDVTARRTAEQAQRENDERFRAAFGALRESEERFRVAFEQAPHPMLLCSPEGEIVRGNAAACELFAATAEQLVGRSLADGHPDQRPEKLDLLERVRSGETVTLACKYSDAERVLDVELTAAPLTGADGEMRHVLVQYVDMSARRAAEEALRRSEEQFRIAFEQSQHGMVQADLKGRMLRVNRRFAELFGTDEAELEGRILTDLVHEDERRAHQGTFGALAAGRLDAVSTLRRFVRRDGSALVARVVAHVVRDGDRPGYVLGQLEDVTSERTALEERAALEEQLRRAQRMEAVGRLAGGVAHDFNNMLSVVLNYADFARRRVEDPTTLQLLDGIKRAADRSAALTRQLMIFAGREVEAPSVIDLNTVVLDLLDLLRRTLGEDVTVETRLAPEPAWVLLAVPHAEQVFMNLAVNARDAMPGGGRLTIGTGFVLTPSPRAGNEAWSRPFVELTVTDSGVGMTPEVLAHAFEPFFTTKGPGHGTGLGLSTVYGIVEQGGGHIEVESAPGSGTTFKIRFPVSGPPTLTSVHAEQEEAPMGHGEHVLVVEDEDEVRNITARILVEAGYAVTSACDGDAALALCGGGHDLVLTDVVMPGLSGTELAERLRGRGLEAPIVFMSGHAEGRLGSLPAKGQFLRKPFDAKELLATVATALRRSRR